MSAADVLPILRTARFDRPLTYGVPAGMHVQLGDVVRVPLGSRETYGFVLATGAAENDGLRAVSAVATGKPAFDATGLELARWIAQRYRCALGEALFSVVHAASVPRMIETFELAAADAPRLPSVPARLERLIWEDFREGFGLETLLRHAEARRAGDRAALLRAIAALQRAGALRRVRTFADGRVREAQEQWLEATGTPIAGKRASVLTAYVAREGPVRRADALLEGFSAPLIARAVKAGALRTAGRVAALTRSSSRTEAHDHTPTRDQAHAIDAIDRLVERVRFGEALLDGVTGSGKTLVYIEAIRRVVARGGRAIVLVPEISLTPQTARRFEGVFRERVAVLHSALSERERLDAWNAAARGDIDVVVGARSAVFSPLPNVRFIAIDEAHERTYKQDGAPRFSAISVARKRMTMGGGVLVLGSATPPLEAYEAARTGSTGWLRLTTRATSQPMPRTHVIDMAAEFGRGNRRIFSSALIDAISERLRLGEKTVLFVNRRGAAGFMLCRSCGNVPECERCNVSLVVHRSEGLLRCHLCDLQRGVPVRCQACGSPAFKEFGAGTERVAEEVATLFPQARVVRMDSDTTTRIGSHARLLDEFGESGDILIGTQMVAKGLDFPTVTLVGAVAADIGLHVPDFRAAERTFDLISQVIGRSGRARDGEAIVQTYSPNHPAIAFAARHDFAGFAERELQERRELRYPPFGSLAYVGIIGRSKTRVAARAQDLGNAFREHEAVETLGPAPYPTPRVNNEWRYRVALKASNDAAIRNAVDDVIRVTGDRDVRIALDLEP